MTVNGMTVEGMTVNGITVNGVLQTSVELAKKIINGETVNGKTSETGESKAQTFIGSIDQGTTSTRFIIFNTAGEPVVSHQMGFDNKHAHSG